MDIQPKSCRLDMADNILKELITCLSRQCAQERKHLSSLPNKMSNTILKDYYEGDTYRQNCLTFFGSLFINIGTCAIPNSGFYNFFSLHQTLVFL